MTLRSVAILIGHSGARPTPYFVALALSLRSSATLVLRHPAKSGGRLLRSLTALLSCMYARMHVHAHLAVSCFLCHMLALRLLRCSAIPLLTSPARLIRSAAPAHSCPNARSPPAISCSDDPSLGCSAIRRSSVLLLGFPVARLLRCLAFGCSGSQHCGLGHSARPAQHVEARPLGSCAMPQRSSHPSGSSQAIGLCHSALRISWPTACSIFFLLHIRMFARLHEC